MLRRVASCFAFLLGRERVYISCKAIEWIDDKDITCHANANANVLSTPRLRVEMIVAVRPVDLHDVRHRDPDSSIEEAMVVSYGIDILALQ